MLDSFEELKDVALKNLEKCLSNEKMIELSEFAMCVETNRDTEKRISLGKLVDPRGFARNIINYGDIRDWGANETNLFHPPPPKKNI